jgi:predicted dehydrogenase
MKTFWVIGAGYWGEVLIQKILQFSKSANINVVEMDNLRKNYIIANYKKVSVVDIDYLHKYAKSHDYFFVATPPATHFEVVDKLLENGFNIWCEKPLALDSKQAKSLIGKAQKNGLCLFVDYTFLFDENLNQLKVALKNTTIHSVKFFRCAPGKILNKLGVLWDLLPHDLSIISYLFGKCDFESISDQYYLNGQGTLVEAKITLRNQSNFPINISLSCVSPNKTRSIQILHEDGVIAYELVGNKSLLKFYKWGDFAGNDSRGETTSVVLMESKTEPLINAIAEYARLSEENKCHDSLNSTVYELELIESIYNFIN